MTNHTSEILGIWEWGGSSDKFRSLRMAGKGQNGRKSEMEYSPWNCQGSGKQKPSICDPGPTWVGPTQNFTAAVGRRTSRPKAETGRQFRQSSRWTGTRQDCGARRSPFLCAMFLGWLNHVESARVTNLETTFQWLLLLSYIGFMWNLMFACHKPIGIWW